MKYPSDYSEEKPHSHLNMQSQFELPWMLLQGLCYHS